MTRFVLLAQLLLSTTIPSPVLAAELDLRSQLETQYAAMKVAIAAHDANAISALLSSDFVSVDSSNHSEDAGKMIQEMFALPPDPNKNSHTALINITAAGETAVVEQRYEMTTKKIGGDGKMQDIKMTTLSTDTWVNSNGSRHLRRTITNQMDYVINGQAVIHKVRPN